MWRPCWISGSGRRRGGGRRGRSWCRAAWRRCQPGWPRGAGTGRRLGSGRGRTRRGGSGSWPRRGWGGSRGPGPRPGLGPSPGAAGRPGAAAAAGGEAAAAAGAGGGGSERFGCGGGGCGSTAAPRSAPREQRDPPQKHRGELLTPALSGDHWSCPLSSSKIAAAPQNHRNLLSLLWRK